MSPRRLGVLLALAFALAGCDQSQSAPAERGPALTVTVVAVAAQDVPRQVIASGTVQPWEEIVVAAEAQGLAVVEVAADEGDVVEAGQVLLRLNDAVIRAQLDQQKANLTAARAALAEAQANLARAQDLQPRGAVSRQSLDERLAAQRTAAAQVAVGEAGLAEGEARLAQTVIKAPVAGIVTLRSANLGQVVNAGSELFRLIRDSRLELNAEVPEVQFAGLKPGLAALVRAEGLPAPVPATIRSLTPRVDPRTRLGIAHLALPMDSGLKPGMFASAAIDLGAVSALMVPQAAVIWRDGAEGVFLIDQAGLASFRRVEAGLRRDGAVEIRQGIAAGDRVAVQGAGFLEDGDHVGVAEAAR